MATVRFIPRLLRQIADVVIDSVIDNEVMSYNQATGKWINQTAAEAGLATDTQGGLADTSVQPGDNVSDLVNDAGYLTSIISHTHDASDITSGTFADSLIAQSNVTQHEGAITHQNVSGAGANTHAQIDAHIALANEHIDWTAATADFETSGTSKVDGSIRRAITTITADVTLDGTYYTVLVDASSDDVTVELPSLEGILGRRYNVKRIDNSGNTVTIDGGVA